MKPDLNSLVGYFNGLKDQTRYAILGGVVFFILLLDVIFLVSPQIGSIVRDNGQIKTLSEDTRQVLIDKQRINQLRKNLQETRLQLSSLSTKVRPIQEVPAVLSTISSIANEFGVNIDQLTPEKSQQQGLLSAPDGRYYALPIVIKAHCGYHMFGHFLNNLENENMYFIVKDFIIQNDGQETNTHSFSLTVNLILVDRSFVQSKNL